MAQAANAGAAAGDGVTHQQRSTRVLRARAAADPLNCDPIIPGLSLRTATCMRGAHSSRHGALGLVAVLSGCCSFSPLLVSAQDDSCEAAMLRKAIKQVLPAAPKHWVGDGFHVHPVFSNKAFTSELSPFLMCDASCSPAFYRSSSRLVADSAACWSCPRAGSTTRRQSTSDPPASAEASASTRTVGSRPSRLRSAVRLSMPIARAKATRFEQATCSG